ncbi:response regulator transcription factor [Desulfomonile tiedjei]|uniref:Response regulator with CheY-like receiver domain and winged-helix DNA-binding domain n=1 Tax=Desulfomonile tiedjei (strain ATCC 49306 / DSM 6799 / DCB-1) TaxID=706587 RepID=I4C2D5_DESTA|nr:response regulator transcription factor [Desulfomonile tiedjei]AFM23726.1 response regulator with CheY-like receiver domain and winged-helix DNA-binding domain [Desulfomonile tiedjei DSM 6799]
MSRNRILIIDSKGDVLETLLPKLLGDGYYISTVTNGDDAFGRASVESPDFVIINITSNEGVGLCRRLKSNAATRDISVVVLISQSDQAYVSDSLDAGVDDYMMKPVSTELFSAKLAAINRLRSIPTNDASVLSFDDLTIDLNRHRVFVRNSIVELTRTEFRILCYLARHPGWVITREQILNEVKGSDICVTERSVDVQIVGLRRKLGSEGKRIETVRGFGYRLQT